MRGRATHSPRCSFALPPVPRLSQKHWKYTATRPCISPGAAHPGLEAGLRFALVGGFRDELVGTELLAEFLMHTLDQSGGQRWRAPLGIDEDADISAALQSISSRYGESGGTDEAARIMLRMFRGGQLGRYTLDPVALEQS